MGGGTRLGIIAHMLMGAVMLVSPAGTTSPLFKHFGNKLQECVEASSMQALIHLLHIPL